MVSKSAAIELDLFGVNTKHSFVWISYLLSLFAYEEELLCMLLRFHSNVQQELEITEKLSYSEEILVSCVQWTVKSLDWPNIRQY